MGRAPTTTVPSWLKLALTSVAAIGVFALIGIVVLGYTIDAKRVAALAAGEVRDATGRDLKIGGRLDVSFFPRLAILAEDVSLANAPWGSRPELARAKRVSGSIALLPLLGGRIHIDRLVLIEPDVLLETNAKGVGNWELGRPPKTASPAGAADESALDVSEFVLERGMLAFHDGASKRTERLAIERLRLKERSPDERLEVDLQAAFRDQPFTAQGAIGKIVRVLEKGAGWPVRLALATDGAQMDVDGTVDWRAPWPALDAVLRAEVKDTAGLSKLAGRAINLPTPAALSTKLASKKGEQVADPFQITLGAYAIAGRAAVRTGGARPALSAQLASKEVDLAPLATPATAPSAKRERVFSDAPFPLDSLLAVDGDAEIVIDRLVLPNKLPLEAVRMRATLKDGRLDVQPLTATLGGGLLTGRVRLDASKPAAPSLAVNLDGKAISMEKVASALGYGSAVSGGTTELALELTGPAESIHRFVGWGSGELRVSVGQLRTGGAALDAGGGALTSILDKANPFRRQDPYTDVKCAVVRLPVRDGVATSQRTIAYETTKVNMVVAGQINLRTEGLDLAIRPTVKEGLGIGAGGLAEIVRVTGTLAEPAIGIDTLGSARAALSVGGAVATGGLSLLGEALLPRATADPNPCRTALAGGAPPAGGARVAGQPEKKPEEAGLLPRLFK
jgi:hypothetical protein